MARIKIKDSVDLYDSNKLKFAVTTEMKNEMKALLDKIADDISYPDKTNTNIHFTLGNNGEIKKCTFKLVTNDTEKYGFLFNIDITLEVDNSNADACYTFLDVHDPSPSYGVGWPNTNASIAHSFLNKTRAANMVKSTEGGKHFFKYSLKSTDGVWFCLCSGIREGAGGNRFAGQNGGCGPFTNFPLIKNTISKPLVIHDRAKKDGDGIEFDDGINVVELGESYILCNLANHVNHIYVGIFPVTVNENVTEFTVNFKNEYFRDFNYAYVWKGTDKNGNDIYEKETNIYGAKTYTTHKNDDGFGYDAKTQDNQKIKVTIKDGLPAEELYADGKFRYGKYYVMAVMAGGFMGYSNIVNTGIFRVRYPRPTVDGTVSLNESDPLRSIKIEITSDTRIYSIRLKITAKTTSDGKPDWAGGAILMEDSLDNLSFELNDCTDESEMPKKISGVVLDVSNYVDIKKNTDDTWYNNTYYVCARVQAANLDYLWSKYDDNENRNTTGGYKYIGSVKTKNIATFESYPSTIEMGKATTPDAKIKIANKVKYQISVNLPGGIVKNQPASISTSSDDYTADNPLTVAGVPISSPIWDIIYKQLPGGVVNLPSNVSDTAANNLTCTAELISYYKNGTEAGRKSKTLTIALKSSKSIARTVRGKNGNTVKIGMVYHRSGTTIKKCVIWMRKEKTNSDGIVERGVINDAYVGEL